MSTTIPEEAARDTAVPFRKTRTTKSWAFVLSVSALVACGETNGSPPADDDLSPGEDYPPGVFEEPCDGACSNEQLCLFVECVSDPVQCEPREVDCEDDPPLCPRGDTPSVVDRCWGPCVNLQRCRLFRRCTICEENGQLCFQYFRETLDSSPSRWCLEKPPEINCAEPTCDCLGALCGHWPCLEVQGNEVLCGVRTR